MQQYVYYLHYFFFCCIISFFLQYLPLPQPNIGFFFLSSSSPKTHTLQASSSSKSTHSPKHSDHPSSLKPLTHQSQLLPHRAPHTQIQTLKQSNTQTRKLMGLPPGFMGLLLGFMGQWVNCQAREFATGFVGLLLHVSIYDLSRFSWFPF